MVSRRRILAHNTMWNAGGRIWDALSSLILIRYAADQLGDGVFGVWVLLAAFTGYVALLDLGLSSAYVKFNAEHHARDEAHELSAVLSTGICFYSVFGLLLVAVFWPIAPYAVAWMDGHGLLTGLDRAETVFVFRWAVALFAATAAMSAFGALLTGLQRMGITNAIGFGASLIKIGAAVAFIEGGYGLRGLLYAHWAAFIVFAAGCAIAAHAIVPGLRVSVRHASRAVFHRLFGFGFRTQVARLSNLVMFETDVIIAGLLSGSSGAVALYSFGVNMANKLRQLPTLVVSALLPAAADLDARAADAQLRELYVRASKYLAVVAVPVAVISIACAGPVMRAWLGDRPGLDTSIWVLRILGIGYLANVLPGAAVTVALGKGRADLQMKAGLIATGANIALTIALVLWIGFWGIPIATSLSMILSTAWFLRRMQSVVDVRALSLICSTIAWPALAAIPGFTFALWCDWQTQHSAGFLINGAAVLASLTFLAVTYVGLIRFTPCFDAYDVEFMEDTLAMRRVPGFQQWSARARRV